MSEGPLMVGDAGAANVLGEKSPADGSVVSVRHLRKVYEPSPAWMRLLVRSNIKCSVVALDDVDLEVKAGQICAVLGPNGAGKTTTFRILVGLTTPTSGRAEVLGLDAHRESEEVRRLIGWMPADDRSLFLRMTCYENLYFHGRMQNMPRRELQKRIPTTLHQVGLEGRADSSAFSLSSGMRARLQLARALLHRPRLLVLDEPTASIDPLAAHALLELIVDLVHEHQLAALISSHRLEEIEALHSHVVLLDRGRVLYQGDLDQLRRDWDRLQLELRFANDAGLTAAALLQGEWVQVLELSGDRLVCIPAPGVTTGQLFARLGPLVQDVTHVQQRSVPLRELLATLYSDHPAVAADQRARAGAR